MFIGIRGFSSVTKSLRKSGSRQKNGAIGEDARTTIGRGNEQATLDKKTPSESGLEPLIFCSAICSSGGLEMRGNWVSEGTRLSGGSSPLIRTKDSKVSNGNGRRPSSIGSRTD
jgi:hypothetical protein